MKIYLIFLTVFVLTSNIQAQEYIQDTIVQSDTIIHDSVDSTLNPETSIQNTTDTSLVSLDTFQNISAIPENVTETNTASIDTTASISTETIPTDNSNSNNRNNAALLIIAAFICGAILLNNKARPIAFNIIKQIFLGLVNILFLIFATLLKNNSNQGGRSSTGQQKIFWWQCKHCGSYSLPIRKSKMPSNLNCPSGKPLGHQWTRLAEVGDINYQCLHCNVQIQAKSLPSNLNCPSGKPLGHKWAKL